MIPASGLTPVCNRQLEAAYEAGIEAAVESGTCPWPQNSPLARAWQRGFADAERDLPAIWGAAMPSASAPPNLGKALAQLSEAEKQALICNLWSALVSASATTGRPLPSDCGPSPLPPAGPSLDDLRRLAQPQRRN